jgi:hypothetical protein
MSLEVSGIDLLAEKSLDSSGPRMFGTEPADQLEPLLSLCRISTQTQGFGRRLGSSAASRSAVTGSSS